MNGDRKAWKVDLVGLTIDLVVASTLLFFLSKMTDGPQEPLGTEAANQSH